MKKPLPFYKILLAHGFKRKGKRDGKGCYFTEGNKVMALLGKEEVTIVYLGNSIICSSPTILDGVLSSSTGNTASESTFTLISKQSKIIKK